MKSEQASAPDWHTPELQADFDNIERAGLAALAAEIQHLSQRGVIAIGTFEKRADGVYLVSEITFLTPSGDNTGDK